jgi:hypothetical protein
MEGEDRAHDEMNNALQVLFGGVKDDERQKVNDTSDTDGSLIQIIHSTNSRRWNFNLYLRLATRI